MGEAIVRNLAAKTGKDISEWLEVVIDSQLTDKKAVTAYLKQEHGLGHFQAQKVYEHFAGQDHYADPGTFAGRLFTDPARQALYADLKRALLALGADVREQPCRSYLPFYRKHQFAAVLPAGKDGLAVALNLPADFRHERFDAAGSKTTARLNQQTVIDSAEQIDAALLEVFALAYQNN